MSNRCWIAFRSRFLRALSLHRKRIRTTVDPETGLKRWQLVRLTDLAFLPPDDRDRALEELRTYLSLVSLVVIGAAEEGKAISPDSFEPVWWTPDGEKGGLVESLDGSTSVSIAAIKKEKDDD